MSKSFFESYALVVISLMRTLCWVALGILTLIIVLNLVDALNNPDAEIPLAAFLVGALFAGLIILAERGFAAFQRKFERELKDREARETPFS